MPLRYAHNSEDDYTVESKPVKKDVTIKILKQIFLGRHLLI